jgi:hypothetical protein
MLDVGTTLLYLLRCTCSAVPTPLWLPVPFRPGIAGRARAGRRMAAGVPMPHDDTLQAQDDPFDIDVGDDEDDEPDEDEEDEEGEEGEWQVDGTPYPA